MKKIFEKPLLYAPLIGFLLGVPLLLGLGKIEMERRLDSGFNYKGFYIKTRNLYFSWNFHITSDSLLIQSSKTVLKTGPVAIIVNLFSPSFLQSPFLVLSVDSTYIINLDSGHTAGESRKKTARNYRIPSIKAPFSFEFKALRIAYLLTG
ncbi:hypothetical protein ACFL5V_11240 [Fibrobacterota bacterium]